MTTTLPSSISPVQSSPLTLAQAARIMREATRDKSYQLTPMGHEAASYLRAKRTRLTESSYRDYEGCLDKLARHFPDLDLDDFEPPVGTERVEQFLRSVGLELAPDLQQEPVHPPRLLQVRGAARQAARPRAPHPRRTGAAAALRDGSRQGQRCSRHQGPDEGHGRPRAA